jgi:hypothetical protein
MIRRADIITRRKIRLAMTAWRTINIRAAMVITRLAHSLPTMSDAAMCILSLIILALAIGVGR